MRISDTFLQNNHDNSVRHPMMHLTFLGTGAPISTAQRVQTGLLLEFDTTYLLIDCGSGVLHRLAQSDTDFEDVSHVLLTHLHPDHVSDPFPLLRARQFLGDPSLDICGPNGTERLVNKLLEVHGYHRDDFDITVREVSPGSFSFAYFDIIAIEARHVMYCLAYRIAPSGEDAPVCTFSGDSEAFDEMAEFADGSDVFVHDCANTDNVGETPHATPYELGEVLSSHQFGEVYLTHLYPETDGQHDEMLQSIHNQYSGEVCIAQDGLVTEVVPSSTHNS